MVVILKPNAPKEKLDTFIQWTHDMGLDTNVIVGDKVTIVGLIGDTTAVDMNLIKSVSIVDDVKRIQEPYKATNRRIHPEDTIIEVGNVKIGEGTITVMAGPCSIESDEQICRIAKSVKEKGATMLRGGAFKPRTSPYAFQGMGEEGINAMLHAKKETGLPIVTELMSAEDLQYFDNVDMIQIGARNMQNFALLKEVGKTNIPVLLKRGLCSTLEELLMSAEYIMAGGNKNVILCERGIRTYETATRNTLDISAIPFLKSRSHLPVIVDPSHAAGNSWMIPALSRAAIAAGADGLMIEVHNNPEKAWSDGPQSLTPDQFGNIMNDLKPMAELLGKDFQTLK